MEKVIGVTQARSELNTIVDQVKSRGETFIIQRHGKAAAVLVPIEIYELWKQQKESFFETFRQTQKQADLDSDLAEEIAAEAIAAIRESTSHS
ncbi:MAG: type II toxin-antitoxin system Phd/YefM family antitoxin [Anaerolineales bacterium]|nr:type II toxin-antitoxin system Phd/YefM family antitoxin [Anaerolineales bacterium]